MEAENITVKLLRYLILFTTGFCVYITIEVCFRGYSYPLMGFCGGIILILLDQINEKISWDLDLLVQGCIGSAVTTAIELIIGKLSLLLGLEMMWDYSRVPLNYLGIICLPYSLAWIAVSIAGILTADAINYYVFDRLPVPYYKLFGRTVIQFKQKSIYEQKA